MLIIIILYQKFPNYSCLLNIPKEFSFLHKSHPEYDTFKPIYDNSLFYGYYDKNNHDYRLFIDYNQFLDPISFSFLILKQIMDRIPDLKRKKFTLTINTCMDTRNIEYYSKNNVKFSTNFYELDKELNNEKMWNGTHYKIRETVNYLDLNNCSIGSIWYNEVWTVS